VGPNDRAQNKKDERLAAARSKRKLRDHSGANAGTADWAGVDGAALARFVAAVSRDGGAARLGYTRDGGAYAIGIYGDGDPYTVYVPPSEDINDWLRQSTEDFEA